MADDIVTRLRQEHVAGWVHSAGECATCDAANEIERLREERDTARVEASIKGYRLDDALDEIERLRAQVESAHNIIGSETMVWVFHGSEGWLQANLQHLKDPIHLYWETYGNAFKEARRG